MVGLGRPIGYAGAVVSVRASAMPRFSANISMLFRKVELAERMRAARRAGFEAVEVRFPYAIAVEDWLEAKRRTRIRIALFNIPAGDFTSGGPGLAS